MSWLGSFTSYWTKLPGNFISRWMVWRRPPDGSSQSNRRQVYCSKICSPKLSSVSPLATDQQLTNRASYDQGPVKNFWMIFRYLIFSSYQDKTKKAFKMTKFCKDESWIWKFLKHKPVSWHRTPRTIVILFVQLCLNVLNDIRIYQNI